MNTKIFQVLFVLLLLATYCFADAAVLPAATTVVDGYVGAPACQQCHREQYQLWQQSDHVKSMQIATTDSVLGDFSDVSVNFHNSKSRLYRDKNRFLIDTLDEFGKAKTFQIKYTFGFYPLQQYLVETDNGHIQALNISWDSREQSLGGQRWFHLRADDNITPEHLFYWTRHFQNWNSRCADCHSTNVKRNYTQQTHSYQTTWSEINVACEACHGAGQTHLKLAKENQLSATNSGFSVPLPSTLMWQFKQGNATAYSNAQVNDMDTMHKPGIDLVKHKSDNINMCGSCHSLRTRLNDKVELGDYHNNNSLQLVDQGSYFADGQIQEEVFVTGSFMQSKMYEKGVTCNNCHNPHSGKLLFKGNALCSQCHVPQVFDTKKHHRHPSNSEGAACVNCHMPARTYMTVDDRRDHSFTIPRPTLSDDLAVPNACVNCHNQRLNEDLIEETHSIVSNSAGKNKSLNAESIKNENGNIDTVINTSIKVSAENNRQVEAPLVKNNQWAIQTLKKWGVKPTDNHWAYINQRLHNQDVLATPALAEIIKQPHLPSMIRASLIAQLAAVVSPNSVTLAQQNLHDNSPLVRKAAITALAALPAPLRWQLLSPHISDTSASVRHQLTEALADIRNQLPADQQKALAPLIDEYKKTLQLSNDTPATQLSIANLQLQLGNTLAAETALLQSLRIEPNYVPALINLADYYRGVGQATRSEALLKNAIALAPDSGAAQFSYGLLLVRKKAYELALVHLKNAVQQADAQPRFFYVYAVALDNNNQTRLAIDVLIAAIERWPNQYDLLATVVLYLEKSENIVLANKYIKNLEKIAPASPVVKRFRERYSR